MEQYDDEPTQSSSADYSVLMEALGEVVQEYVAKKKNAKEDEDDYMDY